MSSSELAEKISGLWVNAKLFEKGLKLFDGKYTHPRLTFCWIYVVGTTNIQLLYYTTTFV